MPEETGIINVLSLQRSMRAIIPVIIFGVGKVSQIFGKNHSKFERKTQPRLVTFSKKETSEKIAIRAFPTV